MKKKTLQIMISVSITLILFIFLFKKIPYAQVQGAIKEANISLLIIVQFLTILNGFLFCAVRWKWILNRMGCNISIKEAFFIKAATDPIIAMIPLKMGEASRVIYLKKNKEFPVEKSIFSISLEYFLNLLAVVFFICMGFFLGILQGRITINELPAFLFLSHIHLTQNLNNKPWMIKLKKNLQECIQNKQIYLNTPVILSTLILCFLEIICVFILSKALNINIPSFALLIYIPVVITISSIPVSILGLGVRESLLIACFIKYAPIGKLFALGILYSFCEQIIPMFAGLCFTSIFLKKIIDKKTEILH